MTKTIANKKTSTAKNLLWHIILGVFYERACCITLNLVIHLYCYLSVESTACNFLD